MQQATKKREDTRRISVIGTGDFGCALTKRLLENGYQVLIGSRHPNARNLVQRDEIFAKAEVTDVATCLQFSNIIIVAIPQMGYDLFRDYAHLVAGKVLVDVSNPYVRSKGKSNAERLAELMPRAKIVKAFNTVSAYSLSSDVSNEHRQVFVASDHADALEEVCQLARDMGFAAHNAGRLLRARELEAQPLYLFKGWGWPTAFTIVILLIECLYLGFAMYYELGTYDVSQFPTYLMYKAFGAVSLNLLAFCYLPGILAAFAQIYYGTKHQRFQVWLDKWLLGRKQLGIYSLLFGFMHMITLMSCMNGGYFKYLFQKQYVTIHVNATEDVEIPVDTKMNLHGEGCIITGLIALCAMGILGLTSIPPVGAMLNWREWRFIQSQFGFVCFLLTVGHCMVHGVSRWLVQMDTLGYRNSFTSLLIPWFTLFLKLIYFIPCVHSYVWKVRSGYERGVKQVDPEAQYSATDSYANKGYVTDNSADSGLGYTDKSSTRDGSNDASSSSSSSSRENNNIKTDLASSRL